MLEHLVAEARQRWDLDPRAGLQAVPASGLAGYPLEPSRLLVVLADPVDRADRGAERAPLRPVPGRHGHPGEAPLELLGRLYPADHEALVAGRDAATEASGSTVGALTARDLHAGVAIRPLPVELA